MQFVVKYSPEITIKGRAVRSQMSKQLADNLRAAIKPIDTQCRVKSGWGKLSLSITVSEPFLVAQIIEILAHTPGIAFTLRVREFALPPHEGDSDGIAADVFEAAYTKVADYYLPLIHGRSFVVRCKRTGKHDFRSGDVERTLGAMLLSAATDARVQLKNPDVTVRVEIHGEQLLVVERRMAGQGGFPQGSLEPVLSLVSGGFDSTVASYLAMRRGLKTHFLFFSLGGDEHRIAVQEIAIYLWKKYAPSQKLKFISVPFEAVVDEMLRSVDHRHMGVILKRLMLQAADRLSEQLNIKAVVTGECVAQVSSQTLTNLAVIDQATEKLIMRPLIFMDKEEIISIAARIGTEEFSRHIPEYCSVISRRPRTRVKLERVVHEEQKFDMAVLDEALNRATVNAIDDASFGKSSAKTDREEVEIVSSLPATCTVLDIRHPNEHEQFPLKLEEKLVKTEVLSIPFYELNTRFSSLPTDKIYYLYCDRGLMSRLHASYLSEAGYNNIKVYRPSVNC